MSAYKRVVWSEGLFLQPQHFQQQERYLERYIEGRCRALIPHGWGLADLEFERDLLTVGKLALRRVAGVFPDGTPFQLPDDDALPEPIEIGADVRNQVLFLALPLRRAGEVDVDRGERPDDLARHRIFDLQVRNAAGGGEPAALEVGGLRARLLLAADVTPAYACIPLARVVEVRADRHVILDDQFVPTVLGIKVATRLAAFASELLGLLHQRAEALAGRVSAAGRGAAAEFAEFLMLQVLNRYEPLVAHLAESGEVHPEEFYRVCVSMAGELATFTTTSRRPPTLGVYRHAQLQESFDPVILALRDELSKVLVQAAIPIPIQPKKHGFSVAVVGDRTLFGTAVFVLAARADLPAEELRKRFPQQLKVGPAEKISDLVRLGLPGVPVHPLPVAPRQIPFHAGSTYFELDQTAELWTQLKASGGIALHVPGDLPGLAMEFWAIRT